MRTTKQQRQQRRVERGLLLDVVVRQRAAVLQPLPREDQPRWWECLHTSRLARYPPSLAVPCSKTRLCHKVDVGMNGSYYTEQPRRGGSGQDGRCANIPTTRTAKAAAAAPRAARALS